MARLSSAASSGTERGSYAALPGCYTIDKIMYINVIFFSFQHKGEAVLPAATDSL